MTNTTGFFLSVFLVASTVSVQAQLPNWYGDYWCYRYTCQNGRRNMNFPGRAQIPTPAYTSCDQLRAYIEEHACQNQGLSNWECSRCGFDPGWRHWPYFNQPVSVARNDSHLLAAGTRLQQIQGPLRAGAITRIGLIADETIRSVGGLLDLEVWMAHAPNGYRSATTTFATNRGFDYTQVVSRRTLSFSAPQVGLANPVAGDPVIALALDVPFFHDGVQDMLIEFAVYSNSGVLAVDQIWAAEPNHWGFFQVGDGCETNGSHLTSTTRGATSTAAQYSLDTTIAGAPPSAAAVIILGPAMRPTAVPGACGDLMTQPLVTLITSTGNGSVTHSLSAPSSLSAAGLQLSVQGAAFDAATASLRFSNSTLMQVGELVPSDVGGVTVKGGRASASGTLRTMVMGWAYQ
ncbi:MAG: hypothetical protein R3F56_03930 [Planctomycetota bacterium]